MLTAADSSAGECAPGGLTPAASHPPQPHSSHCSRQTLTSDLPGFLTGASTVEKNRSSCEGLGGEGGGGSGQLRHTHVLLPPCRCVHSADPCAPVLQLLLTRSWEDLIPFAYATAEVALRVGEEGDGWGSIGWMGELPRVLHECLRCRRAGNAWPCGAASAAMADRTVRPSACVLKGAAPSHASTHTPTHTHLSELPALPAGMSMLAFPVLTRPPLLPRLEPVREERAVGVVMVQVTLVCTPCALCVPMQGFFRRRAHMPPPHTHARTSRKTRTRTHAPWLARLEPWFALGLGTICSRGAAGEGGDEGAGWLVLHCLDNLAGTAEDEL